MVMMSNHRCLDCLLNRLFRWRSKKTSKLHVTGLCEGNLPVAGGFPSQRASNMEMFPFDDIIMVFCTCFGYVISSYLSHVRNLPIFFRVTSLDYFIGLPQCQWSNPELMCIISHYNDVIMSAMALQITSLMIVYSIVYWDADQRKHQNVTGLCVGNSPVTGEFPAQRASNSENVSIWWCHHELHKLHYSGGCSNVIICSCLGARPGFLKKIII